MKDKKKNNRLWSGDFKLKVVLDIIENELSYSQAARKYDMYLSSGSLNDTLPARWVYHPLKWKKFARNPRPGVGSLPVEI